jgi:hypothetical protein
MGEQISHRMPESIRRVAKGEYEVKGTALRIVQGDGKWTVQGHSDDLGTFGSRGAALGKLQELGLVPAVDEQSAEAQQRQDQAQGEERKEQPHRRPRTRKAAKEAATV